MFRKILLPYILLAAVFLLDTAVLPVLSGHWLMPVFGLVQVHCLGLLMGRARGALDGMILGLAVDISVGTPLGLMTAIYALMGYAGGLFGRLMWKSRLVRIVPPIVCFTLYELLMDAYMTLFAAEFDGTLFLRSLARVPIYTILTFCGCFVLDRLIRPSRSRFAPR